MTTKRLLPLFYIALVAVVLVYTMLSRPEPEIVEPLGTEVAYFGMEYPANYRDDFVQYLIIDRPDGTVRHVFASPDVTEALANGEEIPFGAQFVIETYDVQRDILGNPVRNREGRYQIGEMREDVHVMEKRADWTMEQLPSPIGVIDWNFASFIAETGQIADDNRNDCLTCHDAGAFRRDFIFSRSVVQSLVNSDTDDPRYIFCSRSGRSNCIR